MVIFHIDVNNAFLSWDAVYRLTELNESLDLRDIPAVIGGDEAKRHGIVLAKSMPAKAYGIRTAETLAEARKKCPNITIVPPRHHIYKKFSGELITHLQTLTPVVEQYSIDEAFADMTGCPLLAGRSPVEAADLIREDIYRRFGYTVNIGVSSNKVLAKMASDFEKPDKVHSLFPHEIEEKMWPLPVSDLFLVGRASAKKLYNLGIRTIGELARSDKAIICSHMGKHGTLIHDYANGIDPSPVLREQPESKGYGNSTTLPRDVTDAEEAKHSIRNLCDSVGSRLRADYFSAQVIAVTIKDNRFRHVSHQCTMPAATNVTGELYHYACALLTRPGTVPPSACSVLPRQSLRGRIPASSAFWIGNFMRGREIRPASPRQNLRGRVPSSPAFWTGNFMHGREKWSIQWMKYGKSMDIMRFSARPILKKSRRLSI